MKATPQPPRGWLPVRLRGGAEAPYLDWCAVGEEPLTAPFFDQAIECRLREHPHALRSTPLEALRELAGETFPSPPDVLIFHLSRCGSTLISRMFSAVPRLAVFSEPTIVEVLLRGRFGSEPPPREGRQVLLRGLLRAFAGYRPCGGVVLKLAARAVEDAALLAEALPEMTRVFVYRDPVEVLVSLVGSQAEQLPPGLARTGLLPDAPEALRGMRPAEFWARVLARQCEAALALAEQRPTLLLNYRDLPRSVWEELAPRCDFELSPAEVERMLGVPARHAKSPGRPFTGDGASKQQAASEEMRTLAERWVQPHYERLEALPRRKTVSPISAR